MKKFVCFAVAAIMAYHAYAFESEFFDVELEGDSIKARLSLPNDKRDIKAVVVIAHGTGPATYEMRTKAAGKDIKYYDILADEFTKRGLAFVSYNRRGIEITEDEPWFYSVDGEKYSKYLPETEAKDLAAVIKALKEDKRFENSRIILFGLSEGTIIASIVADKKLASVDALILQGYVNENLSEVVRWQFSGAAAMLNLGRFFDADKDGSISREEYESEDPKAAAVRKEMLGGATFEALDKNHDGKLDKIDFYGGDATELLLKKMAEGDDEWIWNNYFRITSAWLKAHFDLEPNKTRLLRIDMPVYIFHGSVDAQTPVEGARDIENAAKAAGKKNIHVFVFDGHDHGLNIQNLIFYQKMPEGLLKLFEFAESFNVTND